MRGHQATRGCGRATFVMAGSLLLTTKHFPLYFWGYYFVFTAHLSFIYDFGSLGTKLNWEKIWSQPFLSGAILLWSLYETIASQMKNYKFFNTGYESRTADKINKNVHSVTLLDMCNYYTSPNSGSWFKSTPGSETTAVLRTVSQPCAVFNQGFFLHKHVGLYNFRQSEISIYISYINWNIQNDWYNPFKFA